MEKGEMGENATGRLTTYYVADVWNLTAMENTGRISTVQKRQ